jgi:type II secretory ATPase GspE/PulE/Tfp pilus assembly ATPase PilB-like protein
MSQDARFDEEQATARRAQILNVAYTDTTKITNKLLYKQLLATRELYTFKVIPLQADPHHIVFGITNTTSQQTLVNLRQRFTDQQVSYSLISDAGYREYMRLYDPPEKVVYHDIEISKGNNEGIVQQVSKILDQVHSDDMLAYLVQQAHRLNASDIHIENQKHFVRVRFRIDGVLHTVAQLTQDKNRMLIAAIASAANLSTAANEAQQGHISEHVKMAEGTEIDINVRVETVPAVNGTDIVMRLFNLDASMFSLGKLGLSARELAVVEDIIKRPTGLVLIVGPTGSGKTTTLYSLLNSLKSDERKIITIEDPVEYQFDGITQVSMTSKTTEETHFADELRAVLRLDPDIVMVGEIRDMDTARTAMQASLTGHLVLSTFHAGSASAALTRLMDVIGQNPLFIGAIRLVMAQRLVRRLDDKLKQPYTPDETVVAKIRQIVEGMPANIERPNLDNLQLYKPGGSTDNPFGYSGQIALREQFMMVGEVNNLLREGGLDLTTEDIEAAAVKSGMLTMLQDGMLKVITGQTSIEEIYRVVG